MSYGTNCCPGTFPESDGLRSQRCVIVEPDVARQKSRSRLAEDEAVVAVATGQAAERAQKDGKDDELDQTGPLHGFQFAVAARSVTHRSPSLFAPKRQLLVILS